MSPTRQYCTFLLDGLYFGIEVSAVQEVIRHQPVTRVPCAPRVVEGLINLRGQIVLALDLRQRLELPPRVADRPPMNVIVNTEDGPVSLSVDEIGEVLGVGEETYERPPETLRGAARELICGAHKLKDRLLLALEARKVVQFDGTV